MKKVLILAVFVFTAMSFTDVNATNDKITTNDTITTEDVDCVALAFAAQTGLQDSGMGMEEANMWADLLYEDCMGE